MGSVTPLITEAPFQEPTEIPKKPCKVSCYAYTFFGALLIAGSLVVATLVATHKIDILLIGYLTPIPFLAGIAFLWIAYNLRRAPPSETPKDDTLDLTAFPVKPMSGLENYANENLRITLRTYTILQQQGNILRGWRKEPPQGLEFYLGLIQVCSELQIALNFALGEMANAQKTSDRIDDHIFRTKLAARVEEKRVEQLSPSASQEQLLKECVFLLNHIETVLMPADVVRRQCMKEIFFS